MLKYMMFKFNKPVKTINIYICKHIKMDLQESSIYFNDLPPEIQSYILSQNINLLRQSRRISPYIRELMNPLYMREFCL